MILSDEAFLKNHERMDYTPRMIYSNTEFIMTLKFIKPGRRARVFKDFKEF